MPNLTPPDAAETLEARELSYELSPARARARRPIPDLRAGQANIKAEEEGGILRAPRWQVQALEEAGLVEVIEEPFDLELFRVWGREKVIGLNQLTQLPGDHFYQKLRRHLSTLKGRGAPAKQSYQKARNMAYDLVTIRLGKILASAFMGEIPREFADRLAAEERSMLGSVQHLAFEWRKKVSGEEES